jgi:hypothetical protein
MVDFPIDDKAYQVNSWQRPEMRSLLLDRKSVTTQPDDRHERTSGKKVCVGGVRPPRTPFSRAFTLQAE